MTNHDFMVRLEAILQDQLSPEDLEDVLAYHREYFAEAGESAAAELDPPEVVAQRILDEHNVTPRKPRKKFPGWAIALIVAVAACAVISLVVWRVTSWALGSVFRSNTVQEDVVQEAVIGDIDRWVDDGPDDDLPPVQEGGAVTVSGTQDRPVWDVELEGFASVKVETGMADVTIQEGDAWGLHMEWDEKTETLTYEYDVRKDLLAVTGKSRHNINSINAKGGTVIITVPAGTSMEAVDVETGLGDVVFEVSAAANVELNTGLGDVRVENCSVEMKADCESGLGNVDFTGECWGELDLNTGTGNVSFDGVCGGELDLNTGMGDVTATLTDADAQDYELDLESGLGTVSLNGETVRSPYKTAASRYKLDAESGMGNVSVSFEG